MIVAVSVALPKFVSVAEPDRSPPKVIVGSDVAVVVMLTLPEPSKLVEPVTAPVSAMFRAVCNAEAVDALPVTLPVTVPVKSAATVLNVTSALVPTS